MLFRSTDAPSYFPQLESSSVLICLFLGAHLCVCLKVFDLHRPGIPGGLQSSVGPPAESLCLFLCLLQTLVAVILFCLPEQCWKHWRASGNACPLEALQKWSSLGANFLQFYLSRFDFSSWTSFPPSLSLGLMTAL